ncbi:MAG: ethylbenzene dehydrogenase-related protein [Alsobacter sp.]
MAIYKSRPRTDIGTILLHWGLAASVLVALVTGVRIEAEGPSATALDKLLAPGLPTWRLWFLHIVAGIAMAGFMVAHLVLLRAAGLSRRVSLDRSRLSGLATSGRSAWGAASLVLLWLFFGLAAWQVASGMLIHVGLAPGLLALHGWASWCIAAFVVLHVLCHLAIGGVDQLLRIVRPRPRELSSVGVAGGGPWRRLSGFLARHRVATAVILAFGGAVTGYAAVERHAPLTLVVARVGEVPDRDNDLAHPAWRTAVPLRVRTYSGANLHDGQSEMEARAVHDGQRIVMAFTWQDPTRDVSTARLVRTGTGWQIEASPQQDGVDQFAVMFSPVPAAFGPGAFHPGRQPLPERPRSGSGHGLHYTTDGSSVDVLHWYAGPGTGWCDLEAFGPPAEPTEGQKAEREPYRGGIRTVSTYGRIRPNSAWAYRTGGPARPLRSPVPGGPLWKASLARTPPEVLSEAASAPYTPDQDVSLGPGAVIPGFIAVARESADLQPVSCAASWSAGRWTLVVSRPLAPLRPDGLAVSDRLSVWLAAFDRTASDHSRHIRAIELEMQK